MSQLFIVPFPLCPHCRQHDVAFYIVTHKRIKDKNMVSVFLTCGHCGRCVCAEAPLDHQFSTGEYKNITYETFTRIFPEPISNDAPQYTPKNVADDFKEAKFCMSHGSIKSACIMAGSALETACVQFGATSGGLKQKIDKLLADGVISRSLAEWAQEIRGIRIDAAHHAERNSTVTQSDAEEAVYFTEMVLTYLYTLPGRIAARRSHK